MLQPTPPGLAAHRAKAGLEHTPKAVGHVLDMCMLNVIQSRSYLLLCAMYTLFDVYHDEANVGHRETDFLTECVLIHWGQLFAPWGATSVLADCVWL